MSLTFSDGAVAYDISAGVVRVGGTRAAVPSEPGRNGRPLALRVLIDRPRVEVFVNGGQVYILERRGGKPLGKVTLKTEGTVERFKAYKMRSIWPKKPRTASPKSNIQYLRSKI